MNKIKYSIDLMKFIALFENITRAKIKDCIKNDILMFVVKENEMGKAIGKKGANVRKIEGLLKRKIKIVEFNPDLLMFIRNLIAPLKVKEIKQEEGIVTIKGQDTMTRGLLIGKNAKNLREYESIVKRYFEIEEIKVI